MKIASSVAAVLLLPLPALMLALMLATPPASAASLQERSLADPAPPPKPFRPVAGVGAACTLAMAYLNGPRAAPPDGVTLLRTPTQDPAPGLPEGADAKRLQDFDFDNDGALDLVLWEETSSRYAMGDVFYVRRGPLPASRSPTLEHGGFAVFPCQFDPSTQRSDECPAFSQKRDEAGVAVQVGKDKPRVFFRARYTSMTPVRMLGRTHLLLETSSHDTRMWAAVIEPTGGTGFRSVCLFRRPG